MTDKPRIIAAVPGAMRAKLEPLTTPIRRPDAPGAAKRHARECPGVVGAVRHLPARGGDDVTTCAHVPLGAYNGVPCGSALAGVRPGASFAVTLCGRTFAGRALHGGAAGPPLLDDGWACAGHEPVVYLGGVRLTGITYRAHDGV